MKTVQDERDNNLFGRSVELQQTNADGAGTIERDSMKLPVVPARAVKLKEKHVRFKTWLSSQVSAQCLCE